MTHTLRLGVNIDHVATLRNARGGRHPDPLRAARVAAQSGADGLTIHLREDRRHIRDDDLEVIKREVDLPLNLEMAATADMLAIALAARPHAACLVPEKREERTTEGGLDAARLNAQLAPVVRTLSEAGIRVSLFIEPEARQLAAARALGAPVVELHTGAYGEAEGEARARELARIRQAARDGAALGLEVHAGHGLNFENVGPIAAIAELRELNIGHALIGEAVFVGLGEAIRAMRAAMDKGRAGQ